MCTILYHTIYLTAFYLECLSGTKTSISAVDKLFWGIISQLKLAYRWRFAEIVRHQGCKWWRTFPIPEVLSTNCKNLLILLWAQYIKWSSSRARPPYLLFFLTWVWVWIYNFQYSAACSQWRRTEETLVKPEKVSEIPNSFPQDSMRKVPRIWIQACGSVKVYSSHHIKHG